MPSLNYSNHNPQTYMSFEDEEDNAYASLCDKNKAISKSAYIRHLTPNSDDSN